MATCAEIIAAAYRKPNVSPIGEDPGPEEAAEALPILQSIYDEWVADGAFGPLTDVIAEANYEAAENERVTPGAYTITRPTTVEDEDTGEDRPPRDKAIIQVTGTSGTTHVYSAPRGEWVRISSLAMTDYAPFSERSRDGLASLLAVRLCENMGREPGPITQAAARRFAGLVLSNNDSARVPGQAEFY